MEHIACPGVLIECGFLSNPAEEAKLRSPEYQQKLCCVIASVVSRNLPNT
jgi:N-acetylmuramoyl-L-alanine amidase